MTAAVVLGLILLFPLALGLLFRTSTSHIFFSLMAGELLGRYFGHDVEVQTQPILQRPEWTGYGEVALIVIPVLLTAFFLRNTISRNRIMLHIVPLLLTGIVAAAFVLPVLPAFLQTDIRAIPLGSWLLDLNRAIVGSVVTLQLVALWLLTRKEHARKKQKHA